MIDLQTLLYSIATSKIHPAELEKSFDEVATLLLRHSKLIAGQSSYLLKEIEFYFFQRLLPTSRPICSFQSV